MAGVKGAGIAFGGNLGDVAERVNLLAFRPIEEKTIDTVVEGRIQSSEVTVCQIIEVTDSDGGYYDMGEQPVFWKMVRRQLAEADDEFPWIVGRLLRSDRRGTYRILDPTVDEVARADRAVDLWTVGQESIRDMGEAVESSTDIEPS